MDRMCSWRLCVSIASCGRKLRIDRLRGFKRFLPLLSAGDESRENLFQPRCFINIYDASLHAQTQVNYPNSMLRCTNYMVSSCEKTLLWENHQSTNLHRFSVIQFGEIWPFPTGNLWTSCTFSGQNYAKLFFFSGSPVLRFCPLGLKRSTQTQGKQGVMLRILLPISCKVPWNLNIFGIN